MMEHLQVLIVDDQLRARQSLKALLATCPQVESVGEAANGREALRRIEESQPDVVLMDVRMPEMNGLETTRLVKARWPQVKVIVLTLYAEYASDARAAGADAFVCKGESPTRLLSTLAAVVADQSSETSSNQEV